MQLRFGEQILHTNSAPPPGDGRLFQGAVCSLLPANPCGSVPGSKFFTQIPRRRPVPAGFSKARFAPPSPRALAAPSRGANSSHKYRAAGRGRAAFPWRGLLPAPRKPLQLRSGEQILHINPAPSPSAGRLFQGAVCSPLLASPCSSVPGSKFFTLFPRRHRGPAAFSAPAVTLRTVPRRRTKSTLPVYRQGASLSSTVPRRSQSRGALLIN